MSPTVLVANGKVIRWVVRPRVRIIGGTDQGLRWRLCNALFTTVPDPSSEEHKSTPVRSHTTDTHRDRIVQDIHIGVCKTK